MLDIYEIRNNIIPQNKIKEFEHYLNQLDKLIEPIEPNNFEPNKPNNIKAIIEILYGGSIYVNNIQMIALLNLFVRENNICVSKDNIIEEIYYAECRSEYNNGLLYGCRMQFGPFKDKIKDEYIQIYSYLFKK